MKMENFTRAGKIKDWKSWITTLPKAKGVYAVVYKDNFPTGEHPEFLEKGNGGFFKGLNPNVDIKTLKEKWDNNICDVLYIGKTGKNDDQNRNERTIQIRVREYMRFGEHKPAPHWGGRYIWQLKENRELEIYFMVCDNPETIESELIKKYRPFANLQGGKK